MRNQFCPFKREKQNCCLQPISSVVVFWRITRQRLNGGFFFTSNATSGSIVGFISHWWCLSGAGGRKKLVPFFLLLKLAGRLLSSVLSFPEDIFIRSCASALSSNQSFNSINVGHSPFLFTAYIDQASFKFGGSFCVAWPKSDELERSCW